MGSAAGQQSRIHCTEIACSKADNWYLRQCPRTLELNFKPEVRRPDRDNAVDDYLRSAVTARLQSWEEMFVKMPTPFSSDQKEEWLHGLRSAVLGSDGYIPFRDSIDRAQRSRVAFVVQPGGSSRDNQVTVACHEYGMVMAHTGVRLFHH